jgi:hypothetical protein
MARVSSSVKFLLIFLFHKKCLPLIVYHLFSDIISRLQRGDEQKWWFPIVLFKIIPGIACAKYLLSLEQDSQNNGVEAHRALQNQEDLAGPGSSLKNKFSF